MSVLKSASSFLAIIVAVTSLAVSACAPPAAKTTCAPGLFDYKGTCLDAVSQNFVSCTETRGNNLSVEDRKKIGASVDLGVKGVGGVVEISKKVVETELPDVALEVVRDCLELSKNVADPAQRVTIEHQVQSLQGMLDEVSQGTIALNPSSGPYLHAIAVSGTGWPAKIELEVQAMSAKVRTTTASDGSFRTTIKLDPTFKDVAPPTVEISVHPVKASIQMPATALYQVQK
jgi:hypothetical protein